MDERGERTMDWTDVDAVMEKSRRDGFKKIWTGVVVGLTVGCLMIALPVRWSWPIPVALMGYAVWVWMELRPGPCIVCGKTTATSVPRHSPYVPPAWWDLRPPARSSFDHVCTPHVERVLMWKVAARMLEQELAALEQKDPGGAV